MMEAYRARVKRAPWKRVQVLRICGKSMQFQDVLRQAVWERLEWQIALLFPCILGTFCLHAIPRTPNGSPRKKR